MNRIRDHIIDELNAKELFLVAVGVPIVTVAGLREVLDAFEGKAFYDIPNKGHRFPETIENYQRQMLTDQELILKQRDEIARLQKKLNQKDQKIRSMAIAAKKAGKWS